MNIKELIADLQELQAMYGEDLDVWLTTWEGYDHRSAELEEIAAPLYGEEFIILRGVSRDRKKVNR